jgi:putative tricarboxylic transport membrane protein
VMSLMLVAYVSKGSLLRSLIMACLGVVMSTVGMDPITSRPRFTFGNTDLMDGFDIVYVAMGMFGMGEVLMNLSQTMKKVETFDTEIKNLLPNRQDWKKCAMPIARGTVIGFFLGIIPGFGNLLPTFVSYAVEKKLSKYPEKFGTGVIEGVAGPESTNNASSSATFIPLLSLGLPTNPSTAIILGALMILGLQPGPLLISSNPAVFWGVIASMYIGNVMLIILNLPLIGLWVKILKIPYSILYVLIIMFCQIGAYSVNSSVEDVFLVNIFALVGFLVKRYEFEPAPLMLGLVLGPLFETALRRSLLLSEGSPLIFITRPLSAFFLLVAFIFLLSPLFSRKKIGEKVIAMQEE